jgi:hypothetical protein
VADALKNLAYSLVDIPPVTPTVGTSLSVTAGTGSRFPTPPFNATVWPTGTNPTPANAEIVRVTAVTTDTLTIVRQAEGTSARSVIAGDQIAATLSAQFVGLGLVNRAPSYDLTVPDGHGVTAAEYFKVGGTVQVTLAGDSRLLVV